MTTTADWLQRRLTAEDARREHVSPASALASLYDPRVLALSLVYFGAVACAYGVGFWLPTIVKGFGLSIAMTGWVDAIPYVVGFFGMIWWGLRSDRRASARCISRSRWPRRDRHWRLGFLTDPMLKMLALTFGAFGVFASLPIFWTLPTAFLAGAAVAPGHRGDQRDRQPVRLFRALRHRLDQGCDRQLHLGLVTIAACAASRSSSRSRLAMIEQLERAPEAAE